MDKNMSEIEDIVLVNDMNLCILNVIVNILLIIDTLIINCISTI
jgi:hypothetical protein